MVNAKTLEKEGYDVDFMEKVQPLGNIRFTESAIRTGNGYSTSLWTFRFNPDPTDLWLTPYSKIKDGIVTKDVATQDPEKVLEIIDKATGEMKSRAMTEKSESAKELAADAFRDLKSLGKIVRKNKEVMKYIKVRLFIHADTLAELDRKVLHARKQLEKEEFGVTPLLMEQQPEWQSLFMDYDSQSYLPNRRAGKDIPSREFGASFPANYVRLHDRRGQYLGISNTYGNIIFDPFELDEMYRNFYNILILGQMGFGKSTLMKKIMMDLGAKGYLLRGFDKSGEFSDLIKLLGGKILRLDGQDGMLNLFEIFATIMNESTGEIDQQGCFTQHVSKLSTWYTMIKPKVPDSELDEFEMAIHELYENFGFVDDGFVVGQVAGLPPTSYPILSDLIALIQKRLDQPGMKEKEEERLDSIILTLRKLKQVYKRIFDGHTTFENLENEQVLFFNIDGLAAMDKKIVDAQLFNATNLFWGTLLKNGKAQFDLYRDGKVSFDFIRRSMIFIDECRAGRSRIN